MNIFHTFSSVSIHNFEQVNVSWIIVDSLDSSILILQKKYQFNSWSPLAGHTYLKRLAAFCYRFVKHFSSQCSLLIPPESIRKPNQTKGFLMFSGGSKGNIGKKLSMHDLLMDTKRWRVKNTFYTNCKCQRIDDRFWIAIIYIFVFTPCERRCFKNTSLTN